METKNRNDDLLHGVTLSMILDVLIEEYGFEELSELVRINCFKSNQVSNQVLNFLEKQNGLVIKFNDCIGEHC